MKLNEVQQDALNRCELPDGTIHPGAVSILGGIINQGEKIYHEIVPHLPVDPEQLWDTYVNAGKNISSLIDNIRANIGKVAD